MERQERQEDLALPANLSTTTLFQTRHAHVWIQTARREWGKIPVFIPNLRGPLAYVSEVGEAMGHNYYVSFEIGDRCYIYSSFKSLEYFINYYESFNGPKCFSWVNRSVDIPSAGSLLYIDVGWHTHTPDERALEKIEKLINGVRESLFTIVSKDVDQSVYRKGWYQRFGGYNVIDKKTKVYKNRFQVFFEVTFEHNSRGCMYDFMKKMWATHFVDDEEMYYNDPDAGRRPIVNFNVYARNQAFRVKGSVKYGPCLSPPFPGPEAVAKTALYRPYSTSLPNTIAVVSVAAVKNFMGTMSSFKRKREPTPLPPLRRKKVDESFF